MITVRTFFREEHKRYVDPAAPVRKIAKDSLDPADYTELLLRQPRLVDTTSAAAAVVACELCFESKVGVTATCVSVVNPDQHVLTLFEGPDDEVVQLIHALHRRPRMVLKEPYRGAIRLKAAKHPLPPEAYEVPAANEAWFGAGDIA
jgi:hypothetical protein